VNKTKHDIVVEAVLLDYMMAVSTIIQTIHMLTIISFFFFLVILTEHCAWDFS